MPPCWCVSWTINKTRIMLTVDISMASVFASLSGFLCSFKLSRFSHSGCRIFDLILLSSVLVFFCLFSPSPLCLSVFSLSIAHAPTLYLSRLRLSLSLSHLFSFSLSPLFNSSLSLPPSLSPPLTISLPLSLSPSHTFSPSLSPSHTFSPSPILSLSLSHPFSPSGTQTRHLDLYRSPEGHAINSDAAQHPEAS